MEPEESRLAGGNSQGTYSFSGSDDPFFQANTLDGFANAFLGNIKTYTEGQRVLGYKIISGPGSFLSRTAGASPGV